MSRNSKPTVRSHTEERQWLLNLGQGNLVEGVRTLIQHSQGQPNGRNGFSKGKGATPKK
jgi:hypothetical protein